MTIVKCSRCLSTWDEEQLDIVDEPQPYGDGVAVEQFYACPECGNTDFQVIRGE